MNGRCLVCGLRHGCDEACSGLPTDPRDAELSALRARIKELETDRDRYAGTDGEADPLAVILERYAGIEGLGPTGKVVRGLVTEVRKLQVERDDARRDLEAATEFTVGDIVVQRRGSKYRVWLDPDNEDVAYFDTRDAALAEARRLAGVR